MQRETEPDFSVVPGDGTRGRGDKLKHREFSLDMRKKCEGDHALAKGAQSSCGISILEDFQKPAECSGQSALNGPS